MIRENQFEADLADLRVLVVDDEEDIRLGLGKLVSRLGADVFVAADGKEALKPVRDSIRRAS